jgi:undecaprenyl-diphosphatase
MFLFEIKYLRGRYSFHYINLSVFYHYEMINLFSYFSMSKYINIRHRHFIASMVGYLQAALLGLVQGITEWLPVSSSGHILIAERLLGVDSGIELTVLLHLASLAVLFAVFRKEIYLLAVGVLKRDKEQIGFLFKLILACIPAAIVGFAFRSLVESLFTIRIVGFGLIFTSLLLFLSRYPVKKNNHLTWFSSLVTGIFQAIAILPGISRSGSTISSCLMQGIKEDEAIKFSFLLAIPAILGAGLFELKEISRLPDFLPAFVGMAMSAVSGYFMLRLLIRLVKGNKFFYFGIYTLLLGLLVLFLF